MKSEIECKSSKKQGVPRTPSTASLISLLVKEGQYGEKHFFVDWELCIT